MVDAFWLENSFHHSLIICLMQNQRRLVVERKENPGICHYSTTSMHPSSSTYLGLAGGDSRLGGVILTSNTFHFLPRGSHGIPMPDEIKKN